MPIRKYKAFVCLFVLTGIINSCHEPWKRCERLVGLTTTQCSNVSVRSYVDLLDPALNQGNLTSISLDPCFSINFSRTVFSTWSIPIVLVLGENIQPNSDKCLMLITLDYVLAFCSSLSPVQGEAGKLTCLDMIKAKDSQYKLKANKLSKWDKLLNFLEYNFSPQLCQLFAFLLHQTQDCECCSGIISSFFCYSAGVIDFCMVNKLDHDIILFR